MNDYVLMLFIGGVLINDSWVVTSISVVITTIPTIFFYKYVLHFNILLILINYLLISLVFSFACYQSEKFHKIEFIWTKINENMQKELR